MQELSDEEWKQKLTPDQYRVLRQKATEAPGSGKLLNNHESGDYLCMACGTKLFDSSTKFESGSGWPSFYDVSTTKAVELKEDEGLGMHRIEVKCANCGSHLGHLFNDAPTQPTGKRFCINSCALDFKPQDRIS
ncbi:MAG TPA: peptide-methionine (R)-S-oxide reductase MsrB [Candidatus Dormibacteraeota bacterium]|nr:peptide-methionine (R)-S-oxide reductase MsrB [Candidatus Dormibacteraeota bacterium]